MGVIDSGMRFAPVFLQTAGVCLYSTRLLFVICVLHAIFFCLACSEMGFPNKDCWANSLDGCHPYAGRDNRLGADQQMSLEERCAVWVASVFFVNLIIGQKGSRSRRYLWKGISAWFLWSISTCWMLNRVVPFFSKKILSFRAKMPRIH